MLTSYKTPDPLPAFARRRALAVFTVESREDLARILPMKAGERVNAARLRVSPNPGDDDKGDDGGGGGAGGMRADFRRPRSSRPGEDHGQGGQGARPLQAARQPHDLPAHGRRRRRGRLLRRRRGEDHDEQAGSWRGPRCRGSCASATRSTRASSSRRRTCRDARRRRHARRPKASIARGPNASQRVRLPKGGSVGGPLPRRRDRARRGGVRDERASAGARRDSVPREAHGRAAR